MKLTLNRNSTVEYTFLKIFNNPKLLLLPQKEFMMEMKSRRTFLRIGIGGILIFFAFVWNKLTLNHIALNERKIVNVPFPQNESISFINEYIVVNKDNTTRVLTAHCTHLGCKINKTENGRLVCPCHGSEYDLSGKVVKGPAYKNLVEVQFKISSDGAQIEING